MSRHDRDMLRYGLHVVKKFKQSVARPIPPGDPMNTMVKLPDSRWPGWRRRLYWWMHEAVEAEEVISLDLETTSLDPRRADILSIGAVLVRRGKLVMGERLELYVEPPPSLDAESIRIHKLRRADLEGQLQLEQALRQVLAFIGDRPLLGYYLSFDVAVLNRHLRQLLDRQLHNPSIEISSLYHRKVSRHFPDAHIDLRFDTLARALDVPVSGRHTALGDAQAVALMFMRLLKGPAPKVIH
ncbi:DNA polymerase III subunit epsilon [Pseudomonas aeruginosa]|nr:DNA polymerase III subunit epsilon [Pseudomonas aeruginosa]